MGQKSGKHTRLSRRVTAHTNSNSSSSSQAESRVIENFIVIWLDVNINESNEDIRKSLTYLRRIVNSIKIFTDPDRCIQYLSEIVDEQVFLIVSGKLGQQIIPRIFQYTQLTSIYIFCSNKSKYEKWAQQWRKIQGVFIEIEPLCGELKCDVRQSENDLIPISIIPSTYSTKRNELDQSFMYSQLLKEILLANEYDEKEKNELVRFCRLHCADNKGNLQMIKEFKQEYIRSKAVWWYTRECFLYPMLNKALRTQDVEVIIKMGFFVRDLHQQLEQMYSAAKYNSPLTLYRGQGMVHDEFEKMKKSKGGLLSFNNFLSTSTDGDVSFKFACDARDKYDLIPILFRMEIDPSISKTPFASLKDISSFSEEKEILFSMHTVFRIGEIKQIKDRVWQVDLKLTSDNDEQLTALTDYMREATQGPTGLHRMAQLMIKMAEFDKAEEIYLTLLETTSSDDRRRHAHLHHQLGLINDEKGDFDQALLHYQQSLNICLSYLSSEDPSLSPTYSNIGAVYKQKGQLDNALQHFERALASNLQTQPPNQLSIATDYNNIGGVLKGQSKFHEALKSYRRAIDIEREHLLPCHPSLAITYNNIAAVYDSMRDHSNALSFYEKALEIQERSLTANHPSQAITHNNMSYALDGLHRTKEAIRHAEQAVHIDRCSLASDHPQRLRHERNLEELRRNL